MITTKPAKGVKGMIIRTFNGIGKPDSHVFRVYGKKFEFVDYDIRHYDLAVEILDDAVLYDDGEYQYIDYKEE